MQLLGKLYFRILQDLISRHLSQFFAYLIWPYKKNCRRTATRDFAQDMSARDDGKHVVHTYIGCNRHKKNE